MRKNRKGGNHPCSPFFSNIAQLVISTSPPLSQLCLVSQFSLSHAPKVPLGGVIEKQLITECNLTEHLQKCLKDLFHSLTHTHTQKHSSFLFLPFCSVFIEHLILSPWKSFIFSCTKCPLCFCVCFVLKNKIILCGYCVSSFFREIQCQLLTFTWSFYV